jgi:hypothetical protein
MESYVIRVYRRDAKDPEKLAGLVELIDREEQKRFGSFDELRKILGSSGEPRGGAAANRRHKGNTNQEVEE